MGGSSEFISPFGIIRHSRDAGHGHGGIDIPLNADAPIYAVGDGAILSAEVSSDDAGGSDIKLLIFGSRGEGWGFLYEHVTLEPGIAPGSAVTRGQLIAKNGLTKNRRNNHFQLSYMFNEYTFYRDHRCWVDHLDPSSKNLLLDYFNSPEAVAKLSGQWETASEEDMNAYKELLNRQRFPEGPQLCYPLGLDVRVSATLSPTPTPSPVSPTAMPTTTAAIATETAELAAICSFDEAQRRLSCHQEGQSGGQLKWTSNVSSKGSSSEAYEVTFDWGELFNEIQVQLEECHGPSCSLATTTFDVELQPRGDCPSDFTGWFTTFPLPNLSAIYEVGPPGRILTDDYKGHGYFRVPDGQNVVDVRMPIDATLYAGSVYLAPDEPQYLLFFRTACEGLSFLFDHIREPVPAIAELFTDDPPAGDSRTYTVGPLEMKEADLVGTSIGTLDDGNAFVDFGVNDNFGRLPTPQHPNAHGRFLSAVCIYTFFDPDIAVYLRSVEHPRLVTEEGLCR